MTAEFPRPPSTLRRYAVVLVLIAAVLLALAGAVTLGRQEAHLEALQRRHLELALLHAHDALTQYMTDPIIKAGNNQTRRVAALRGLTELRSLVRHNNETGDASKWLELDNAVDRLIGADGEMEMLGPRWAALQLGRVRAIQDTLQSMLHDVKAADRRSFVELKDELTAVARDAAVVYVLLCLLVVGPIAATAASTPHSGEDPRRTCGVGPLRKGGYRMCAVDAQERAAILGHELKQPLNVMRMATDNCLSHLAAGKMDPAYVTAKLERLSRQIERAAAIIRYQPTSVTASPSPPSSFDARQVVRDGLDQFAEQLRGEGIEVQLELDDKPCLVRGERIRLEQVILNLLANARDAIGSVQEPLQGIVRVRMWHAEAEQIVLEVIDNGPGIAPELLDHIFEPYVSSKSPSQGAGLGLAVSARIVRAMGGSIVAINETRGARFCVTLPTSSG